MDSSERREFTGTLPLNGSPKIACRVSRVHRD